MARTDAGAVVALVAAAAEDGVRRIEGVHRAIARRSWRPTLPWGAPSKAVHDVAATVAYASVGAGLAAGGAVVTGVLDALAGEDDRRRLADSPAGAAAVAVLAAIAGDHLARQGNPLAVPMTIRSAGTPLPLGPSADGADTSGDGTDTTDGDVGTGTDTTDVGTGTTDGDVGTAGADHDGDHDGDGDGLSPLPVPDASGEVVLLVHGLAGWDGSWRRGPTSYGEALRERLGATPLHLRYNTGLPVAENGAELAVLLDRLVARWPVPLRRLHLVGHSMGGLVIRSACHAGEERGHAWTATVRHCAYLGTPHLGAPLARAAVALGSLLVTVPELRPFATLLARPSGGVRDLRFGLPLAAGIDEADPHDWFGRGLEDLPLLATARHHAVTASLSRRPGSPVDRLLGDVLVLTASAAGRGGGRHVGFDPDSGAHVPGAGHISLLDHPVVLDRLAGWLAEP